MRLRLAGAMLLAVVGRQAETGNGMFPQWSHDGRHIVFTSDRDGDPEIYVMRADGSGVTRLTHSPGRDAHPYFSRDDRRIVFQSPRANGEDTNIYVMQADGSGVVQLTRRTGFAGVPAFSPDNTLIAFQWRETSDFDDAKKWRICVMHADGTDLHVITAGEANDQVPNWSPDGTRLMFYSDRAGRNQIYTMNLAGGDVRRLINTRSDDTAASWSPDGTKIVFTSEHNGSSEIYAADAAGGHVRRLTFHRRDETHGCLVAERQAAGVRVGGRRAERHLRGGGGRVGPGITHPPGAVGGGHLSGSTLARRSSMHRGGFGPYTCALMFGGFVFVSPALQGQSPKATPLILQAEEGERRVWRPIEGLEDKPGLFILKVDPHNGGSSHLVFGTEDIEPGGTIESHHHPHADEILYLQNGSAKVRVGDVVKDVHGATTVFYPAGTEISVVNTGSEPIHLLFVFSAPGFEEFMRAESVRDGEKVVPLSRAEDAAIQAKHRKVVIYRQP